MQVVYVYACVCVFIVCQIHGMSGKGICQRSWYLSSVSRIHVVESEPTNSHKSSDFYTYTGLDTHTPPHKTM